MAKSELVSSIEESVKKMPEIALLFVQFVIKQPYEIKKITNKMVSTFATPQKNAIQYRFDEKTNQIVGVQNQKPPLKALRNGEEEVKFQTPLKENGVMCDHYAEGTDEKALSLPKNQKPGFETLRRAFPNVAIIRDSKFEEIEIDVLEDNELHKKFTKNFSMVPFQMPNEFDYTGAIMVNNLFEGLLHSFVRHYDTWCELIPGLENVKKSLKTIEPHLKKIQKAGNMNLCGHALNDLDDELAKLMSIYPYKFMAVKFALLEAQLQLHKYMQQTMNSKNARMNKESQSKESFKVPEKVKGADLLNICVSTKLYPVVEKFGSQNIKERPVRVIKTAFFSEKFEPLVEVEEPKQIKPDKVVDEDNGIKADCYESHESFSDYCLKQVGEFKSNCPKHKPTDELLAKQDVPILTIASDEDWLNLKNYVKKSRDSIDKYRSKKQSFTHLRMPKDFSYTTAIMTNNQTQGLLHSFIRHWDQWLEHIPSLYTTIKSLDSIKSHLNHIKDAPNPRSTKDRIVELNNALQKLPEEELFDVQIALFDAQMKIRDFVQEIIIPTEEQNNYLKEGANFCKQMHAYFRVPKTDQLMVLGVSKQLFPVVDEFDKDRPVRFITTVYFISRDQFPGQMLIENNAFVNFPKLTNKQKIAFLDSDSYKEATPLDEQLRPRENRISKDDTEILKTDFEGNPPQDILDRHQLRYNPRAWLLLEMPDEFGYTCVIMLNSIYGGTLHILARHLDDWSYFIDIPEASWQLLEKLAILDQFAAISDLDINDTDAKDEAYANYTNVLDELIENEYNDLIRTLFQLQMKVYIFMQKSVVTGKYLGEGVNDKKQVKVYFEVVDFENNTWVMTLGVSWQLWPIIPEYDIDRPIRTIITAYFREWNYYGYVKHVW